MTSQKIERPTVYFSNRLEELGLALGRELFKPGSDPFAKRIVLLPGHSLKWYLSSLFALNPEWNICAGVSFKTLLEGAVDECPKQKIFPSKTALSFAIEQEILQIIEHEKGSLFEELKKYLNVGGLKELTDQKVIWVSEELSQIFYRYSLYETAVLKLWLERSGWQQWIWKRIFSKESSWSCLTDDILQKCLSETPIHLFGFSHIPSHLYQFFCDRGATFYFLSPCSYFWEDLCSDKERIFLEKKMEGKKVRLQVRDQMVFLLKQTHSLLANWGKVGRSLLRRFGDTQTYLEEMYVDPLSECLLTRLQSSFLQLEVEEEEEKKELSLQDCSFLCLSASSKLREVESLFETLQELMTIHADIEPKDVLVFSSDLESYVPFIQMVFGVESSKIGYSLHGLSSVLHSKSYQTLSLFFSLASSRFDRRSVLQFISLPSVMKKFQWKEEDIRLFEEWFEKANILWGLDLKHKQDCLDATWPQGSFARPLLAQGSWEEGLDRLFQGLAMDSESLGEESVFPWPLSIVDWASAEQLGVFTHVLASLKEDLRPIYEDRKQSFADWVLWTQKWLSFYFDKSLAEEALYKDLERLKIQLQEKLVFPLSFTSFKRAIEEHFQGKKESFQSSHLNAVKFLPAQLGSAYPAKVICLLGCDEGSFPRSDPPSCLEDFQKQKETPSLVEQDRYFLLELILHARQSLIVSYVKVAQKDQKEQGPSLLIQELMNHLDECYFLKHSDKKPSKVFTRHHPSISFDRSYFQKESPFYSFSESSFALARSYYFANKMPVSSFFPSWKEKKESSFGEVIRQIEMRKLQDFAKDPAYFYLKEKVGIFFDFVSPKEKEFFLPPLIRSQIKQEALKKGLNLASFRASIKGQLPLGELGQIAVEDLQEDLYFWQEGLSDFGVKQQDLFEIELLEGTKCFEKDAGRVICPPLAVEVEGVGTVFIQGNLHPVCSKGLIWLGKTDKQHLSQLFPSFLVFLCLAEVLQLEKQCLLLESGKIWSLPFTDPFLQLGKYLKLYMRSLQEPCPVRPSWALDFLRKSPEEIQKKHHSLIHSKGWVSSYDEWMCKRDPFLEVEFLQKEWKQQWEEVFFPLLEEDVKGK